MKINHTISKIIAGVLGLGALVSCNAFLDKEPLSAISPEQYYATEAQLQANVLYVYQNVLPMYGQWTYGIFGEDSGTDNQIGQTINNRYVNDLWKTGSSDGNWSFTPLYHINYFFQQALPKYQEKAITGTDANIRHYIGEMYFLRAWWYFDKLKLYGDFPIIEEPLPDEMEPLQEASRRSPQTDVVRFILGDLDQAISYMGSLNLGTTRINSDLAQLFKSRVALYEATWLQNFKGTAFVPGGTDWPGAKMYPSYSYPAGSIDQEIDWLLTQAMTAAKVVGDKYASQLTENKGYFQQSTDQAANPYFEMYTSEDLSGYPEVLLWRQYGASIGTHNVNVAAGRGNYVSGLTRGYVQNFLMADGTPVYTHGTYADGDGYYMGDKTLADVAENRDTRLSVFLKVPGQHNVLYELDNATGSHWTEIEEYPLITSGDSERAYSTGYALHKGGNLNRKYYANGGGYTSYPLVRAAEAMLNYMEASYLKNGSIDATADGYWRALRRRAKVDEDYQKTIDATDMAKEAENDWGAYSAGQVLTDKTLYNIRRERRCEYLAEGLRYMDLRRWRAMDQLISTPAHLEGMHLWNTPMESWYSDLKPYPEDGANVSSKEQSEYLRPFETLSSKNGFNGATWHMAHYLNPIGISHLLLASPTGKDADQSAIYQNPYWPIEADQSATR